MPSSPVLSVPLFLSTELITGDGTRLGRNKRGQTAAMTETCSAQRGKRVPSFSFFSQGVGTVAQGCLHM